MRWFDELLYSDRSSLGYIQRFKVDKVLKEVKTKRQHLLIFETPYFGRVLVIDGVVQTTEKDEFAYHEMLSHVPILAHGKVKRVLIVGGGDGGVLKQVLRHRGVTGVTVVEIDETVIELCEEYLPLISEGAFKNPRTNLVIDDGFSYLAETTDSYDVIIVDSTDPFGPGETLFTEQFYNNCHSRLKMNGILVSQNGVPFTQEQEFVSSYNRLQNIFKDTTFYLTVVPTYVGGYMALGWASDFEAHRWVTRDDLAARYRGAGLTTCYYSPDIHKASFVLPPFITEMIA
ncbi:polyamine aminopropyltransferase [Rhodospirillales bacterium]|nr:polyamine aminopropyltransferase [Rhodospirillales bacterium]